MADRSALLSKARSDLKAARTLHDEAERARSILNPDTQQARDEAADKAKLEVARCVKALRIAQGRRD